MRVHKSEPSSPAIFRDAGGPLIAGGLAALLASTCCVGPLVFLGLGISGAWIGNLTSLEPFRPLFIVVAVVALFLARRRIWRRAAVCASGDACSVPQFRFAYKVLFWVVAALVLLALAFPYVAPFFY